jgi:hypothetical protein
MGTEGRAMTQTIDDLLAAYSPEVRDLALQARALVRDVMPNATEQVDAPAKLIAYGLGSKMADTVCVIMPLKAGVNLGFYGGTALPDPAGLLTGTGKRHRHVRLTTAGDVQAPALRALLRAAVAAKGTE